MENLKYCPVEEEMLQMHKTEALRRFNLRQNSFYNDLKIWGRPRWEKGNSEIDYAKLWRRPRRENVEFWWSWEAGQTQMRKFNFHSAPATGRERASNGVVYWLC